MKSITSTIKGIEYKVRRTFFKWLWKKLDVKTGTEAAINLMFFATAVFFITCVIYALTR